MKILKKVLIILIMVIGILSVDSLASTGVINIEATRLREKNNTTSEILTKIYKNEEVEILEELGDWIKVKYDGKTGYIKKEFVDIKDDSKDNKKANEDTTKNKVSTYETEETPQEVTDANSVVLLKTSYLRVLPNLMTKELTQIQEGVTLKVVSKTNNWMQVSDGVVTGWIPKIKVNAQTNTTQEDLSDEENTNTIANEIDKNTNTTNNTNVNTNTVENTTNTNTVANETTSNNESVSVSKKGKINVETAKVRKDPSTNADMVSLLDKGDEVSISEEVNGWYKIEHGDVKGYVSAKLITITADNDSVTSRSLTEDREVESTPVDEAETTEEKVSVTGSQVVEYAKQYIGYGYVVGGKTPESGFDCSGFTRYVYKNFGYNLASVAANQTSVGIEISREELMPGDLILFYNDAKTKIGHTGIYIGDGEFIHAANPERGVVYDNINTVSYYNERYVTARRIVQ